MRMLLNDEVYVKVSCEQVTHFNGCVAVRKGTNAQDYISPSHMHKQTHKHTRRWAQKCHVASSFKGLQALLARVNDYRSLIH